ncbi:MAG: heme-binding protein [Chitinophagaceae bacterium]|nr:MAG: heme-binding protein [Chitinophagaceae bacterium]
MKTLLIVFIVIVTFFLAAQFIVNNSSNKTEQHAYEVIKRFDDIEIRHYSSALFTKIRLSGNSYSQVSGKGFRILADYIFGGNAAKEKIAMTTPVSMSFGEESEMRFMVPANYTKEDLPLPNNKEIEFIEEKEKVMAVIKFSGWANDKKINQYQEQLIEQLQKNNIKHKGNFSFLGYNPPYQVINRRNEIVVEVEYDQFFDSK